MTTKLTLTIDDSVLMKAKKFAKQKGTSISRLLEDYLKVIMHESSVKEKDKEDLSPLVKSLQGTFKMPANFDYKNALNQSLSEKYLGND